ncbi:MAG: UMP kinase [Planctomycetota bacterium]
MSSGERPYGRVVLKLSGQSLCAHDGQGIDPAAVAIVAEEIQLAAETGVQIAVVIGGGNICRGAELAKAGLLRAVCDHMGMLATVINALALQDGLEKLGLEVRVQTAITMADVAEPYIRRRCIAHLEHQKLCILAAGTGNPFFSTDTAAVLRAREINADMLLKGTKVDGVYEADPTEHPDARLFQTIPAKDALDRNLRVMDLTALTMAIEGDLPILVFNARARGNIRKAVLGDEVGTLVT